MNLLGIDIGSTTVKAVVMDNSGAVLWKSYRRHNARQPETVREFLSEIISAFPASVFRVFITGSGGRTIAPHVNGRYVQEVNAVTYAVEKLHPDTASVIELGGQDAKIIIWKKDEQGRTSTLTFMNDKCAGGTGATIDKIFGKIGLSTNDASRVNTQGKTIHHIAAKCGVFAETDVVGLIKAGVDREEIFVSLCNAIVKQNLEVLVRGNVLRPKILLLGGPHVYLPALAQVWRALIPETWQIHKWTPPAGSMEEFIQVPPDAQYFAAIGAVLFGIESEAMGSVSGESSAAAHQAFSGPENLDKYISEGRLAKLMSYGAVREGLVKNEVELEEFTRKYPAQQFVQPPLDRGAVLRAYIGIDGGSTSSKLVVINEDGVLYHREYVLSHGNPIVDVRSMFANVSAWAHKQDITLEILGTAVTGYASAILKEAFALDVHVVETVAHMKSAVAYYGDVDVICDVGGQDIKVLFMKHGRVVDFKLNTQCSAGNGYFLQAMAEQFDIPITEYAARAFVARKAPAFNYGCAVFMEQDKVNFQQLGWSKEEIMAGLALVLPLNIWNYVVQETNIARIGRSFLLQGGTQKNPAAVKAQVDFIKSKVPDATVNVHCYADVCGAIGAALEAKESMGIRTTGFIGIKEASKIVFKSKNDESTRCAFCANRCQRTFIDIHSAGRRVLYISGYGCEKGMAQSTDEMKVKIRQKEGILEKTPNLVAAAAKEVFEEYSFDRLPEEGSHVPEWFKTLYKWSEKGLGKRRFSRSPESAAAERSKMIVGIPRLLNLFYFTPFYSTYLRCLGVGDVVYSGYTSARLWSDGNKWGAIDPCFPAKVAPAHIYDLLKNRSINRICFPRVPHIQSDVQNTLANTACVIQMGTPEVTHAVFTKDRDMFADAGVEYWKPFVAMDRLPEACGAMFDYFKDRLKITEDENAWAVQQGYNAMRQYLNGLRKRGRQILDNLVKSDKIGILLIGHPYHHDPGLNHGIPDEFQARGFPVMCIESLPVDEEFLCSLFPRGEEASDFNADLNIRDVWMRNFNRNTNHKIWAAKIAARHPNLAVIDLSSFKCGHDAPTYSYVANILDASDTPHFLFHDIDQNKPGATFAIRIQTIEYFLRLEEQRLKDKISRAEAGRG
jgi:predicted CoA-substrate-specific enzyme activase